MKEITEVVFVLDMSGSMHHLTDDTIGGFNSFIENRKIRIAKRSLRPFCSIRKRKSCTTA